MKGSRAASIQATAAQQQANDVAEIKKQLEAIEQKQDQILALLLEPTEPASEEKPVTKAEKPGKKSK